MAITGTTTNYTGRLKDILILGVIDPLETDAQPCSLSFGKPSRFCAGIQKLCQRYLITLLTETNSQVSYSDFGTSLLTQLRKRNNSLSSTDFEHLFNVSNLVALNLLREFQSQNPDLPLDEQISTAKMNDFYIEKDTVYIKIELSTKQEEFRGFQNFETLIY